MAVTGRNIQEQLQKVSQRMRVAALIVGVAIWVTINTGLVLVLVLLDNLLLLPAGLRLPLAIVAAYVLGRSFLSLIWQPLQGRKSMKFTAVLLERVYGIDNNLLINACEFESRYLNAFEKSFVKGSLNESLKCLTAIDLGILQKRKTLYKWAGGGVFLLSALLLYGVANPRHMGNAAVRFLLPLADLPPAGYADIEVTPDSDLTLGESEPLHVVASVTYHEEPGVDEPRPYIVWAQGDDPGATRRREGNEAELIPVAGAEHEYAFTFRGLKRDVSFRVFAGGTYSKNVAVTVKPIPRLQDSIFELTPPAYTGQETVIRPGPPANAALLAGGTIKAKLQLDQQAKELNWLTPEGSVPFENVSGTTWTMSAVVESAYRYQVQAVLADSSRQVILASGDIALKGDERPYVAFNTERTNRVILPGETVLLDLDASDDFGLKEVYVTVRGEDRAQLRERLQTWTIGDAPGDKGPRNLTMAMKFDSSRFRPGFAYVVEAYAEDFNPGGVPGISKPIILRVKDLEELRVDSDNELASAFELLKETIQLQREANGKAVNVRAYFDEITGQGTHKFGAHVDQLLVAQGRARDGGKGLLLELDKIDEGKKYSRQLGFLVNGEMPIVQKDLGAMKTTTSKAEIGVRLDHVVKRQDYVLSELIGVMGEISNSMKGTLSERLELRDAEQEEQDPVFGIDDLTARIKKELKEFMGGQREVMEASSPFKGKKMLDLSAEEEEILGQLAREQAKWAVSMEKLLDESMTPNLDLADDATVEEFTEVFQELKRQTQEQAQERYEGLDDRLSGRKITQENQEGIKEIVANAEKFLASEKDVSATGQEDAIGDGNPALNELAAEMEDIIGELIDELDGLDDDVKDLGGAQSNNSDASKGEADEGSVHGTAAKGVTGNEKPQEQEGSGRSGEGRRGDAVGQSVEETSEGKEGGEAKSGMDSAAVEQGQIDNQDEADSDTTGGGKIAGSGEEGRVGSTPLSRESKEELAALQPQIQQQAETLEAKLNAIATPSPELSAQILGMMQNVKDLEVAIKGGKDAKIRYAYRRVMNSLVESDRLLRNMRGMSREKINLQEWRTGTLSSGEAELTPQGYEAMARDYFRILAEGDSRR